MASARFEFLDDEQELMWTVYDYLTRGFETRTAKPPQRNASGKWHFYLETPSHKRRSKEQRRDRDDDYYRRNHS